MADNNASRGTSTQIRTFYSEGLSYINTTFYNNAFSLKFVPFSGKDANGRNQYNDTKMVMTTIDYSGASALKMMADDIINGKFKSEISVPIPCNNATLTFERKIDPNTNQMSSFLTLTKNNDSVAFKFKTHNVTIKENGVDVNSVIESELFAFSKTIEGYLSGINADRHLNKLTDDFAKSQEQKQGGQGGYNKYQGGNNYKKGGYNNNYKKPYNNYQNNNNQGAPQQPQSWESPQSQSVGVSSYNIPQ